MGAVLASGAVVAVAALAVGSAVIAGGHSTTPAQAAHRSDDTAGAGERRGVDPVPVPVPVPTTRSEKCDVSATPVLPGTQTSPDGRPLSRGAAIRAARQVARPGQESSSGGLETPELTSYPAAASLLTFATADRWMPGSSEGLPIAPNRCVWMVTVDAPFQPRSTPENGMDVSYDGYTVLFDAASGAYLGVGAGTDTPNLITGKNVGADN